MDESEYLRRSDEVLRQIELALESVDGIDYELADGGILHVECADGSRIVINRQAAAREIWVAARSGGFHYRWDGAAWRDTRSGETLLAAIGRLLAAQCGVSLPPA